MALILRDFFFLSPSAGRAGGSSSDPDIRQMARGGKGLKVTFTASHAGMVNGNNVMYSPRGMRDCSHTWVWPQRRPIQVHHDDSADPIGRVINARYAGYGESDVSDGQRDALNLFSDSFRLTKDNVVELAKALEDSKVLSEKDWRGVGELVLDGIITDSDAVEKILDGRYQGVSITQYPLEAFCSLCGHDWGSGEPCEHERGEKDEESGRSMYLVVGDTDYVEISYVNRPADKHAMGVSAQPLDGLTTEQPQFDQKNEEFGILDQSMQTTMFFQLVDSLDQETRMAQNSEDKDKGNVIPDEKDVQKPSDNIEEVQDSQEPVEEPEVSLEDGEEQEEKDSDDSNKDEVPADEDSSDDSDPQVTLDEALKCLFEDRDNVTGFMCDILFEAQQELVEEDAKLSTKKRKSLPGSSFCGPNRSFPVNDCAHYTAAKRLLGRYKGPGDKSKILSCIEGKGKTLGCSTAKKDEQEDQETSENGFALDNLSDQMLTDTLLATEKLMTDRGLKAERKCEKCEELAAQVADFESSVPELQDTVKVLREEHRTVVGEHVASEDAHAETLDAFLAYARDSVLNILLLTDKDTSEDDLRVKVDAMTLEDLKTTAKEIDLSEVISFIRSGLSREPEGTVTQDDAEPEEQTEEDATVKLSKSLVNLQRDRGTRYAYTVMDSWKRAGKLPEDFTLDKALELVAE